MHGNNNRLLFFEYYAQVLQWHETWRGMEGLYMTNVAEVWHGRLNAGKLCRTKTAGGHEDMNHCSPAAAS